MGDLVLMSEPDAGVATVTVNRPEKRNALSIALRDAVSDTLEGLIRNRSGWAQCASAKPAAVPTSPP